MIDDAPSTNALPGASAAVSDTAAGAVGTPPPAGFLLRGEGFVLRAWRTDDAASLATNADNRNVWSNLRTRFPRPYTPDAARLWISRCISGRERGLQLAIDVDGQAVGGIAVELVTANAPRTGEIGYWLGEAHWGRGIGGAAVRLVCPLAFERLRLDRLRAVVRDSNVASLRILERSGFRLESRMRRSDRRPGSAVVEVVYTREKGAAAPHANAAPADPNAGGEVAALTASGTASSSAPSAKA
jgi:ribosomal-protein-alanine N-acetyltransferase